MSPVPASVRWDVATPEALRRLVDAPLPLRLRAAEPVRAFHRDLYFDTPDAALRQRGIACRFRLASDDRRYLMVSLLEKVGGRVELRRVDSAVPELDAPAAFAGSSEAARTLRALLDPAALDVEIELQVERYRRSASARWPRRARFELHYDVATVRAAGLARAFEELKVLEIRAGRPSLEAFARALRDLHGLRALTPEKRVRGALVRSALESEARVRRVGDGRWVALIALDGTRAACVAGAHPPRLPVAEGSGEDACRHLMRDTLGSAVGDLHLLTTAGAGGRMRFVEIWIARRVAHGARPAVGAGVDWIPVDRLLALVADSAIDDPATRAALTTVERSAVLSHVAEGADGWRGASVGITAELRAALPADPAPNGGVGGAPMLDPELSLLAFNARVLELAEDASVPLLERLRYLSIVSANVDEFFMVRVGGLKYERADAEAEGGDGSPAAERLAAVARAARPLVARQYACLDACQEALAAHGVRVRATLDDAERAYLRSYFRSTVFPYLTPHAITNTPGHSLPVIPALSLCIAVAIRDRRDAHAAGPLHFAEVTIPGALPRFVPLPGSTDFVAIEEVIRPELPLLYPGRRVEHAHLFRLTRDAALDVDERRGGDLAQAVDERSQGRRRQPVVRIEVERAMPAAVRALLLGELQLEPGARPGALGRDDEYEIPGLMDLGALRELAGLAMPELHFAPFEGRDALAARRPLWETLRERDVLVHHPYDAFSSSVQRFFDDAADDPDVAAIKATLYRAGERSPIVDALVRAAEAGKDVAVFVEVRARFDERQNVLWAKQLERAGMHVVHGLLGVKNHAKLALVVRREGAAARGYVHVGTGNYNANTARYYTDLGLLTAHEDVAADAADLFNSLTGSSVPAVHDYRACLVGPSGILPALLARIEREVEHARAGRGARIRIKVNGLADRAIIEALYRASTAGVAVELIVRGICTLVPGVPGLSEHVRVVSVLGRFLEHARIFHFENAGDPEYFIGSADWRTRNLSRRVEVVAPIRDPAHRARLDAILAAQLDDAHAWELGPDGTYYQRPETPPREEEPRPAASGRVAIITDE